MILDSSHHRPGEHHQLLCNIWVPKHEIFLVLPIKRTNNLKLVYGDNIRMHLFLESMDLRWLLTVSHIFNRTKSWSRYNCFFKKLACSVDWCESLMKERFDENLYSQLHWVIIWVVTERVKLELYLLTWIHLICNEAQVMFYLHNLDRAKQL